MAVPAASSSDGSYEPTAHALLARLLAEAENSSTTTTTSDVPPPELSYYRRIAHGPWRPFPDRVSGRLVLTTLATTDPFRCNVWLDIRFEPPRLFTAALDWDCTTQEILQRFGLGRTDLLLFLDGALAGDSPALRNGCVLTLCLRRSECLTEPLLRLFPHYPSLRLLQFSFRVPTCILELNRARRAASYYAVPIAYSSFRRDFFFRFAVEAQAAVDVALHQAPLALCCPSFGLWRTTAGFRVSHTAQQLRPFVCETWPKLAVHKVGDTGEYFGDYAYYTITHPSCLTVIMTTCFFSLTHAQSRVFLAGTGGLYDLRAGPPAETPLGAFASRALTAFEHAAGSETSSSFSQSSGSPSALAIEEVPGPDFSVTRDTALPPGSDSGPSTDSPLFSSAVAMSAVQDAEDSADDPCPGECHAASSR